MIIIDSCGTVHLACCTYIYMSLLIHDAIRVCQSYIFTKGRHVGFSFYIACSQVGHYYLLSVLWFSSTYRSNVSKTVEELITYASYSINASILMRLPVILYNILNTTKIYLYKIGSHCHRFHFTYRYYTFVVTWRAVFPHNSKCRHADWYV